VSTLIFIIYTSQKVFLSDIDGEENKDDEDNIDKICSSIIPITEIIKNNVDN